MKLLYIIIQGTVYLLIFIRMGISISSILFCLLSSVLFLISMIDIRTFEIPVELNILIVILGFVRMITDLGNWKEYFLGFFAVSTLLFFLLVVSGGKVIGGGDVKLTASCGLFLGWRLIWKAFFVGCIIAILIHFIRMKVRGEQKTLAMGPYLSIGVMVVSLCGNLF